MLFKIGVSSIPSDLPEDVECTDCNREYTEYIFEAETLRDLADVTDEYCKKCDGNSPKIVFIELMPENVILVRKD